MRTFTISSAASTLSAEQLETTESLFNIKATYASPDRRRRYGSLQVCTGWTRDRVVEKFLAIDRSETAFLLAQQLGRGEAVHVSMQPDELIRWNN